MIKVRDLTIGFPGRILLKGIDFDIDRGDVFTLLGGSGCGKTTLLRHLIGLELPISGSIEVQGKPLAVVEGRRPNFGVMFQSAALFSSMTLLQNVSLPLQRWTDIGDEDVETIARSKLAMVGLGGFERHLPAEISGGMKKRAGIARALVLEPPLLFMDEPSAGLDPVTAADLDELIVSLNQDFETTIVIVTHELPSIFRIATNSIMLDREAQGIIARGDPRVLRDTSSDPQVTRFFRRGTSDSLVPVAGPSGGVEAPSKARQGKRQGTRS